MANVVGLSESHESNLRKLAAYLLALPATYRGFSMSYYRVKTACGTVACAVGHGPKSLGIEPNLREASDMADVWHRYAEEMFGVPVFQGHFRHTPNYVWLFQGSWEGVDNTARGAALRILWLLDNGLPENYEAQTLGTAPLCYARWTPPSAAPEIPVVVLTGPYEGEGSVRRKKNHHAPVTSAGAE